MMESRVPICNTCGEDLGLGLNGEVFVACHGCNYPICKHCLDDEIKEGRDSCIRCRNPYSDVAEDGGDESGVQLPVVSHPNAAQNNAIHAKTISTVSTVDSEYIDESGNPIWKNRAESWKERKNNKKKKPAKKDKKKEEAEIPPEQLMEENPQPVYASQPLSRVVPLPRTQMTSYRIVIIHYRVTNPVESVFGLWLTSVICEIWFAVSWVLDQFPKWSPINRETYIDRLSARYEREGEPLSLLLWISSSVRSIR